MGKLYFARTRDLKYDHMVVSKTQNGAIKGLEKWWNNEYRTMNGRSLNRPRTITDSASIAQSVARTVNQ